MFKEYASRFVVGIPTEAIIAALFRQILMKIHGMILHEARNLHCAP